MVPLTSPVYRKAKLQVLWEGEEGQVQQGLVAASWTGWEPIGSQWSNCSITGFAGQSILCLESRVNSK
jgi:hypothetical protein